MIVGNPIIMILKAILNRFRLRRDYIANAVDKIPPEIKDALVAWYSPVKQKLSNYDVIESYSEDFTKWTKNGNVTSAVTVNNNSIVIDGSIKGASVFKKSNISMQSINIIASGIKNGDNVEYRCVKNGVLQYISIVNGINKLPASELTENPDFNIGFVLNINSTGIINLKQIPTSILKDFSGNKHDAYLYGFKGKLNSDIGTYKIDFTAYTKTNIVSDVSYNAVKIIPTQINYSFVIYGNKEIPSYTVNVQNPTNSIITYQYATENRREEMILTNGINKLPKSINSNQSYQIGFKINSIDDTNSEEITITQIPDYPNQLYYDGKSYAVAYGLPILTDYTIIADRTWFIDKIKSWSYFIDKSKAFVFERTSNGNSFSAKSFTAETSIKLEETNISYQTKTSYNGNAINYHSDQYDNDDRLIIGSTKDILGNQCFIGCHGDILLFNRTLTDDELDLVKEHFFGIVRIKDALMTTDKKYLALVNNNNYIKLNK